MCLALTSYVLRRPHCHLSPAYLLLTLTPLSHCEFRAAGAPDATEKKDS